MSRPTLEELRSEAMYTKVKEIPEEYEQIIEA